MEDRKRRLEALRQLAEQSVRRDEDGNLNVDKLEPSDPNMMDDILARKKARIREIFRKERSGEAFKERLKQRQEREDMKTEGMTDEEIEEWAAKEKEKMRRQFEALK